MIVNFKFEDYDEKLYDLREDYDPPHDKEWYRVKGKTYALWLRIVFPEIDLSIRYGMVGDSDEDEDEGSDEEIILLYPADEKCPKNAIVGYDYAHLDYVIKSAAEKHGYTGNIDDLDCWVDTDEVPARAVKKTEKKELPKKQIEVIDFPTLAQSKRTREYDLYSDDNRSSVMKAYLFDGMAFREMDQKILKLDDKKSNGYQSMDVCHYLGFTGKHKGIFKDVSMQEALLTLLAAREPRLNETIRLMMYAMLKVESNPLDDVKIPEEEHAPSVPGTDVEVHDNNPEYKGRPLTVKERLDEFFEEHPDTKLPHLPDENLKVGQFVHQAMHALSISEYKLTDKQIAKLCSVEESKKYTHRNLAFLYPVANANREDPAMKRYWTTPSYIEKFNGMEFYVYSQWYPDTKPGKDAKRAEFLQLYLDIAKGWL